MEYYWELLQFDGTRVMIPPSAVELVKRRWDSGQPIHMNTGSIPANQIKSFTQTNEPFGQAKLLEDVAQAFKEPMETLDGSIESRWVKKNVTQAKWDKHYSHIGYKRLGDSNG